MRKAVGVMLIILLLGSMVAAAGNTAYATSVGTQDDPYERFWEILNREAELVVQLNTTGNTTLARELIQNSRLGAENAANISALIWQALGELKTSGVKTYYTAEELREMAQNISQNGLPQETVEALKAQGWSDEQIQALEDYIAKNAGEINEDFNMTAFLENFSMAFIDVAFKYNEYETWTLKKWKWTQPTGITGGSNRTLIHPLLLKEWVEFYHSYVEQDYQKMEDSIVSLKESMYDLITYSSNSPKQVKLAFFDGERITIKTGSLRGILWSHDGSMAFRIEQGYFDRNGFEINLTTYYWPSALEAYKLTSDILVLANAMKQGNSNPKLPKMLNQKVAELKDALKVTVTSNRVLTNEDLKKLPPQDPITPIDPINPEPPKNSIKGVDSGTLALTESSSNPVTVIPADEITKIASDPGSSEGILKIDDIEVKPLTSGSNYVNYVVIVHMHTENNGVKAIKIKLNDYSTGEEDSGFISKIESYYDATWESKVLSHALFDGKFTATGKVEITYTPECDGPTPDNTLSCNQERTVTAQYSESFNFGSPIDWNHVGIRIETSADTIVAGSSVTYRVIVENGNSVSLSDLDYSVSLPVPNSDPIPYSGTIDIPANEEVTIVEKTITYEEVGTYVASASIKWNGNSKSAKKSITVASGTTETISMNVDFSPNNPTEGDSVEFDVSLKNPASMSRTVTVKLFIDGAEKSSRTVTLHGGDSMIVTLTWTAQAGEHEWRIEVWEDGKLEASRSGSIEVNSNESDPSAPCSNGEYWTAWLEVSPTKMVGEGKVHVKIMASYCNALPDVGGGKIDLLYLEGSVYLDGKEIHSFNTNANGKPLLVGETKVIDEFDWPVNMGNHNITLKIKNTSGLLDYIKTKTDSVSVNVMPLEYPLELTEVSCSNLNFNFEASNYYTQGNYISPLECTLKFRNVGDAQIYVKELGADISVSPLDLEEAIPDHTTVSVNENVDPGEVIPIQIPGKAVTTDRQMLLRVDGTMATLYIDYTIEGMINGVSKIAGKGVIESRIGLSVNQWIVYADVTADILLLTRGPDIANKIEKWIPIITKVPGGNSILSFISGQPIKNFILSEISGYWG